MKIAILHSTVDGQTLKICHYISETLIHKGLEVNLLPIDSFDDDEILNYHTLIIGASIRYGKHNALVSEFIEAHKDTLNKVNTAFFSVNLVARKDDKNRPDTNPYLIKFLQKHDWNPDVVDVFPGKLDYSMYSFFDKILIRLIMKITKGPSKSDHPIEYTNWEKVNKFALKLC